MKFIILLFNLFVYSMALECGVDRTNTEDFRKVLAVCVKNNETLAKFLDMAMSSSSSSETDSSSSSGEPNPDIKNSKMMMRLRRSTMNHLYNGQENYGRLQDYTTENPEDDISDNTKGTNSYEDHSEVCIVKCVFENLGMADSNGFPEHKKFVEELIKTASNRELRDFLQDSADECFQQMEQENMDPCTYSSKLVGCLAEKGKANCADWPVADLPFSY